MMKTTSHGKRIEIKEIDRELILRDIIHFGFCCYSWNDEGELTNHTQDMVYGEKPE